jgi:copper resistance protein C
MLMRGSARRVAAFLLAFPLAVMLLPGLAAAHSDLVSSDPAQGAVVPSPYSGPIVLTFSEHLASGSMADLVDSAGTTAAKAVVDPNSKTMTFTLTTPLAPGAWQVRWVSIADDGDVLRQPIIIFTVAPAASTSATASPIASVAPSAGAALSSAAPSAAPSPAPSGPSTTTGSGSGDVVLPIIVALIIVGASAAYLLTRRPRPPAPT